MLQVPSNWIEDCSKKTGTRHQSNKQVETLISATPLRTPNLTQGPRGKNCQDSDQSRKTPGQTNSLKRTKAFTELTERAKEEVLIKKLKDRNPNLNSQNIKDLLANGFRSKSMEHSSKFNDARSKKWRPADDENQDKKVRKEKIQEQDQIRRILIGLHSYQYPFYKYEERLDQCRKQAQPFLNIHLLNGALDYNLFRHQLFALSRKEAGILPGTLGIKKQLKLLKVIAMQCPYVDIDKPTQSHLLSTSEIFRYKDFAKYDISDYNNASYEIFESYDWCSSNRLIEPTNDKSDTIPNLLISIARKIDGSINQPKELQNNLLTVKDELNIVRKRMLAAITPITNNINMRSLYYIQTKLENLRELVWIGEDQPIDIVRVKKVAEDIYTCINGCIQRYFKHVTKERYEEEQEEWKQEIFLDELESLIKDEKASPLDIWATCRAINYGYIYHLKARLKCCLSYDDDEVKKGFNALFENFSSFVRHRKCLDVNWKLVNTLLSIYEGFSKVQDGRSNQEYSKSAPEIITMTADLLLCWYPKSLKLNSPFDEKLCQKVAVPFYYHRKRSGDDLKPQNASNLYGLNVDTNHKEQNKGESQGKKEVEMMEKELVNLISQTLSEKMFPEFKESYRTHSHSMELKDIKIIIFSNESVKSVDISPPIFQKIKINWDKIFQEKGKAKPQLAPAYLYCDFVSLRSEKKQKDLDSQKTPQKSDQNLTYFNYEFLESLFSSKNKITLSERTYFVARKLLGHQTRDSKSLRECVSSMSEIASKINGTNTNA